MIPLPLLLAACTGTPDAPVVEKLPDIVLVTLDTVRADRIGAYGDPLANTPQLDALAARGVVFREAITPVPLTLPAHTSMLSGRYPSGHGVRDNAGGAVPDSVPLVAEAMRERGYHTGAFVGAYVLDSTWGLDRGFDVYDDAFNPEEIANASAFGDVEHPAREVVQRALAWWEHTAGPRFLWVHLFDAHHPYEPSVDWTGDPYRGEIFEVDRSLRPLLEASGDAWIVVAGDHGENLWDGGELQHGVVLTRSVLRVPLVVRPPGGLDGEATAVPRAVPERPASWAPVSRLSPVKLVLEPVPDAPEGARVVETPVSLVDVGPTLLDVAGLGCDGCDGRSLLPAVRGEPLPPRPVFAETLYPLLHYGWAPAFAAHDHSSWLVRSPSERSYAHPDDPWWQRPGEVPSPELAAWVDRYDAVPDRPAAPVDAETASRLAALGYVTTTVTAEPGPLPDASTRIALLQRMLIAQGEMGSDPRGAQAELIDIIKQDPGVVDAWFSLGVLQLALDNTDGALVAFQQVLARAPGHPLAMNNAVLVLRRLGRVDEALALVDQGLAANPRDARWHRYAVSLYAKKESPAQVLEAADRGLALDAADPYLLYMKGLALLQLDRAADAAVALEGAKQAGTQAGDLHLWIGRAHAAQGHIDEAVSAFHAQARRTPRDLRPVVAAGLLLAEHGRCPEALPFLDAAAKAGVRDAPVLAALQRCKGAPG